MIRRRFWIVGVLLLLVVIAGLWLQWSMAKRELMAAGEKLSKVVETLDSETQARSADRLRLARFLFADRIRGQLSRVVELLGGGPPSGVANDGAAPAVDHTGAQPDTNANDLKDEIQRLVGKDLPNVVDQMARVSTSSNPLDSNDLASIRNSIAQLCDEIQPDRIAASSEFDVTAPYPKFAEVLASLASRLRDADSSSPGLVRHALFTLALELGSKRSRLGDPVDRSVPDFQSHREKISKAFFNGIKWVGWGSGGTGGLAYIGFADRSGEGIVDVFGAPTSHSMIVYLGAIELSKLGNSQELVGWIKQCVADGGGVWVKAPGTYRGEAWYREPSILVAQAGTEQEGQIGYEIMFDRTSQWESDADVKHRLEQGTLRGGGAIRSIKKRAFYNSTWTEAATIQYGAN